MAHGPFICDGQRAFLKTRSSLPAGVEDYPINVGNGKSLNISVISEATPSGLFLRYAEHSHLSADFKITRGSFGKRGGKIRKVCDQKTSGKCTRHPAIAGIQFSPSMTVTSCLEDFQMHVAARFPSHPSLFGKAPSDLVQVMTLNIRLHTQSFHWSAITVPLG